MTVRFKSPREAAFDANGNPRSGAKLYFYAPTTLTPKDVYSDTGLTTPITQPVTASSAGLWATIYMDPSLYRVILKDLAGSTIWDEDNYDPGLAAGFGDTSAVGVAQGGTGAVTAAAARANLGAASSEALTLAQNTITDHDTKIDSGLNEDDPTRFGLLAKEDAVTVDQLATGFGLTCIQRVVYTTLSNLNTNALSPAYDASLPQVSEGVVMFTTSFTPLSASSTIRIWVHITGGDTDASTVLIYALFKDTDADAIAADSTLVNSATPAQADLIYEGASGSTSPRTYSVRCGVNVATIFFYHGTTGALGGGRRCFMEIEEWVTS